MANKANTDNVSISTTVTKDEHFKIRLMQVDAERKLKATTGLNMTVTRGSIIRDLVRKGMEVVNNQQ